MQAVLGLAVTVTKDQAQMLTALAVACRPNGARRWDSAGVMAALEKVRDRNLASVILATIRAASDRDVETPGVIPTNGTHWQAADRAHVVQAEDPTAVRCTICKRTQGTHGIDHPFALPKPPPDPDTVAAIVARTKGQLGPMSGPTERRTPEDLAAANPELHQRIEAARAALPGIQAPPMREIEHQTTEDGSE